SIPRVRREMETYGVSSAARWKAELGTSRTPQPCLLSYGPADVDGNVVVRLTFDHRIFDGALAGRALSRLDQVWLPRTQIRAYRWFSPPRIGCAIMSPNRSIGRVQGASLPSERCVRTSL